MLPAETGSHRGLAYSLWLPEGRFRGGIVVLHGAGSCKENHHDFARAAVVLGLGAICFDQRGHGESVGALDGQAVSDVVAMAAFLRERLGGVPIALRGSSMGGCLAILAARAAAASAVIAICPASPAGLLRGLKAGAFSFSADPPALEELLRDADLHGAVAGLAVPLLILHAEGDERVPVEHSRELAGRLTHPESRLITVPGGHHRSIQHDEELQAVSLRWLGRVLEAAQRP